MTQPHAPRLQRLADRFTWFADKECPDDPLYQALCRIVAADPSLLDLLRDATDEQQRPNLWLAAVHERLLAGVVHPLAAYYPSVGGTRAPDSRLASAVADFTAEHEAALRDRMRTATTQTNEIGRSAVLWPALHEAARRAGNDRLALLDLGCSAGLNLGVDHYASATRADGQPLLDCRTVGPHQPVPRGGVEIVSRLGIDPHPIDVFDDNAVRWLQACLWPADTVRAERLRYAVATARQHRWPVQKHADCTAFVARWLDGLPHGVQPVVFNSWVLTYFDASALQRHIDTLTALVRDRGLMWLSAEGPAVRIGGPAPPAATAETANGSSWTLLFRHGGRIQAELLARSHPHGRWVEWFA